MFTRSRRVLVRGLAALAGLMVLAAACGRGDAAPGGASRAASAHPPDATVEERAPSAAPGFDPAAGVVRVGVISPLTGPVAVAGEPYAAGTRVFFDALNDRGGVAGRYRVELLVEDNAYDQPTTIQKYQKLKDRVALFAFILGTGAVKAVLPQLRADDVVAGAASLDADWVAEEHLLPLAASAQVAFINAASWYVTEGGGAGQTICMMAVDNPYGDAGVEGLRAGASASSFEVATVVRYKQTDQEFTAPITQLRNARCQAVFLTGLPSSTGPILGSAAKLGFAPRWIGQAPTWIRNLADSEELLPTLTRSFLVVSDGPQWGDTAVPGMRQMLADIAAHRPDQPPDIYFAAGYAHAKAVHALLEEAVAGGDLTRAGILAAQRRLGEVDLEGLLGNYTYGPPERRNPTRTTTIFRVNPSVPGALEAVKAGFTTRAATEFSFDRYLHG